jgi:hypothetical protein
MPNKIYKIFPVLFILLFASLSYSQADDSVKINYSFINSIPQNAKVYLNDTLAGETPFRFTSEQTDTSKPLNIILKLEGYLDYSFSITSAELLLNKTISLVPIKELSLKKEKTVMEDKSSYFKTPRKVVPIVVTSVISAGSGVLSYYYKKLANESYDEYLTTGNSDKFDETKKYDLYSGIFLAAFQAALVGLLYFLLID